MKINNMAKETKKQNKGEWTESYVFFKLILNNILLFGDENQSATSESVTVKSLAEINSDHYLELRDGEIHAISNNGAKLFHILISDLISQSDLIKIYAFIKQAKGASFKDDTNLIDKIKKELKINKLKQSSRFKPDFQIGFDYQSISHKQLQPIGIKSQYSPTLLNAGKTTNFIYEVVGFKGSIDTINDISGDSKIINRVKKIISEGGKFNFIKCERPVFEENLIKVDSLMPKLLAKLILFKYTNNESHIRNMNLTDTEKIHIKSLLKASLLGMFPSKIWDGNYTSNGSIDLISNGEPILYHVIKDKILKDYLFNVCFFETASSTRHEFAMLYKDQEKLMFKLNCQIRYG
jgi:DNA (cytosine-5)-methyltransferase 1